MIERNSVTLYAELHKISIHPSVFIQLHPFKELLIGKNKIK